MKVALWGSYGQGNFGDDLMAGVFGTMIRNLGYQVQVYDLAPEEAQYFDLPVSNNLAECMDGAAAVVLGGGALLKNAQYLRALLHPLARPLEMRYLTLRNEVVRYDVPVIPLSIGSDGAKHVGDVSVFRRRVFQLRNCARATVRLRSDVDLVGQLGVDAEYVPDVLFRAGEGRTLKAGRARSDLPETVVINAHKRHVPQARLAIAAIRSLNPNARITVCSSHLPGMATYEWLPEKEEGVDVHRYRGVGPLLDLLADTDLVISSKLHIGICCMAMGGNFISIGGLGKVQQQFRELDLLDTAYLTIEGLRQETVETAIARVAEQSNHIDKVVNIAASSAARHAVFLAEELSRA